MEESPCAGRRRPSSACPPTVLQSCVRCAAAAGWICSPTGDGALVRFLGEDQAVRSLLGIGVVLVCLGLAGWSVFGKKTSTPDATAPNGSGGAGTPNHRPSPGPHPPP